MSTGFQLQTNNKTFFGRYWTEHSVLRRYIPSDENLSILSFGCSTGEELATINLLFPAARLFGCDTDWYNLSAARALLKARAAVFLSRDDEIRRHGPYDIILCNSVLLQPGSTGIDPVMWNEALAVLDSTLKPGGILQIINSNIPFRYHKAASQYQSLRSPLIFGPNFVDQFDPNGNHLCSGVPGAGWSAIVSRHLGEEAWTELTVSDFQDVHFRKGGTGNDDRGLPAVEDEMIPNLPAEDCWASGTMTYRPQITPDPRPSTHTEIDVAWTSVGVDSVRLNRTSRRIWFDGKTCLTANTIVDMTGPTATAFIEAATGRRSTRLTMDALLHPQAIRS